MIITIGGKIGSGKSTVAQMLANKLGYTVIGIGDMKRELAKKMWLTILERDQIGWSDPAKAREYDLQFDEYQKSLSLDSAIVLDSKLWFWNQPHSFKIFVDVSDEVGAQRVLNAQRDSDARNSYEEVLQTNAQRHQGHKENYTKLYGVDIFDMSHYDLVIDTTSLTPEEVLSQILEKFTVFIKK